MCISNNKVVHVGFTNLSIINYLWPWPKIKGKKKKQMLLACTHFFKCIFNIKINCSSFIIF